MSERQKQHIEVGVRRPDGRIESCGRADTVLEATMTGREYAASLARAVHGTVVQRTVTKVTTAGPWSPA